MGEVDPRDDVAGNVLVEVLIRVGVTVGERVRGVDKVKVCGRDSVTVAVAGIVQSEPFHLDLQIHTQFEVEVV